jgi:hypothetical protein
MMRLRLHKKLHLAVLYRRPAATVLALLLGPATALAVAAICNAFEWQMWGGKEEPLAQPRARYWEIERSYSDKSRVATDSSYGKWLRRIGVTLFDDRPYFIDSEDHFFGKSELYLATNDHLNDSGPGAVLRVRWGWPFPCRERASLELGPELQAVGDILLSRGFRQHNSVYGEYRRLYWPGLIADSLLYILIWLVILHGLEQLWLSMYRKQAIRRRICPDCGYDLRGQRSEGCPECGWNRRNVKA